MSEYIALRHTQDPPSPLALGPLAYQMFGGSTVVSESSVSPRPPLSRSAVEVGRDPPSSPPLRQPDEKGRLFRLFGRREKVLAETSPFLTALGLALKPELELDRSVRNQRQAGGALLLRGLVLGVVARDPGVLELERPGLGVGATRPDLSRVRDPRECAADPAIRARREPDAGPGGAADRRRVGYAAVGGDACMWATGRKSHTHTIGVQIGVKRASHRVVQHGWAACARVARPGAGVAKSRA